jgi:polyhydroxybutyrate depolymerase
VRLRPYGLKAPRSYSPSKAAPLVIAIHGYGDTGPSLVDAWHLDDLSEQKGFLLAYPTGTVERSQRRLTFWNATDSCCDFYDGGVDDVAYILAIIDDVSAHYAVDPARVYIVGFSNGGFMGHRLACDASTRIAAIVSVGGATFRDPSRCAQSSPVAVLEVHGTADQVVPFDGGALPFKRAAPVPSAEETARASARANGCRATESPAGAPLDLDVHVEGAETTRVRFDGCPEGAAVELWTVRGGAHASRATEEWAEAMWGFLEKQRRATVPPP